MSSLELKDLPDHVIEKILSYIPGHYEVSSVCKRFYELDCNITRNKSNLKLEFNNSLYDSFTCDEKTLESILASSRRIRQMFFEVHFNDPAEIEIVGKIFQKHGASVTALSLWNNFDRRGDERKAEISEKTLIQWLNCFSSLKKLDLRLHGTAIKQSEKCTESPEILKLPKLEDLSICSKSLAFFINRLPTGLRKFGMNFKENEGSGDSGYQKTYVLKLQLLEKLKKMKLEEVSFRDLSSITVKSPEFLSFLLTQQDSLKSLIVRGIEQNFEREFFRELKILKKLEFLKVDHFANFNAESFSKLTKLKRLEISYDLDDSQLHEICLIQTVPLEELNIQDAPTGILELIGQNLAIKNLRVHVSEENLKFYMQNFPRLETLNLRFYCRVDISTKISGIYLFDRVFFPNLKTLIVHGDEKVIISSSVFLFEIFYAFPNLEELEIRQQINVFNGFLKILKKSLGRLRKLQIRSLVFGDFEQFSSEENIRSLQEVSNALESVKLRFIGPQEIRNFNDNLNGLRGYYRIIVDGKSLTLRK